MIFFEIVMFSSRVVLGYQPNDGLNNLILVKKVSILEIDHFDLLHLFFFNYILSPQQNLNIYILLVPAMAKGFDQVTCVFSTIRVTGLIPQV